MDSEKTALEQQRAAYRAFVQGDLEQANAESQAKARDVAAEEEIRGENSRKRQEVEARQAQEEKAEEERGVSLRKEENQATAQREAELNRASRARIEELERLKQQAKSRATVSREWANERLRDTRNAANEGGVLVVKALGRQVDKLSPTAATATGSPELGLEQAALVARRGISEIRAGLLRLEAATRSRRQRLLAGCIVMLVIMVVVGVVVAYQIPSKAKTARRLFNQYQPELNAAYGKNDMDELKKTYGSMLKDAEKEQIEPENFRQGLKPSWYNELLPGLLDGAKPGALKDFTYYGRIYAYLSQTMTLPEAKGRVEECWQEDGLRSQNKEMTKCVVDGKLYSLNRESIVFSKDMKVLTGEVGEVLAGVNCTVRYDDGLYAPVVQITGSREASLHIQKWEDGRLRFGALDITALLRQADGEVKDGNFTKAMLLYEDAQEWDPKLKLSKKIAGVQEMIRSAQAKEEVSAKAAGKKMEVPGKAVELLQGYAGIRYGDVLTALESRLKKKIPNYPLDPGCDYVEFEEYPGVMFMVEKGIVTRVDALYSSIENPSELKLGMTSNELFSILAKCKIEQHKYVDTGHYFVLKSQDAKAAIVFEVIGGKVTAMRAGLEPSVEYVEGCM